MDTIKNAIGLGSKSSTQEGQEPVSGVQGQGAGGEPFDAGNSDDPSLGGKAAQDTTEAPTSTTDTTTQSAADTADKTTTSGKSDLDPTPTTAAEENEPKESKKPSIGSPSWFKTALPIGQRKDQTVLQKTGAAEEDHRVENQPGAVIAASQAAVTGKEEEGARQNEKQSQSVPERDTPSKSGGLFATVNPFSKNKSVGDEATTPSSSGEKSNKQTSEPVVLPPNHLGEDVPEGLSTDLAEPNTAPGSLSPVSTSAMPVNEKKLTTTDGPTPHESTAPRRSTLGSNPNAIPTAGGVPVGASAMEERRQSVDPDSSSGRKKSLSKTGSRGGGVGSDEDASRALTHANTLHNTGPVMDGVPAPGSAGLGLRRSDSVDDEGDGADDDGDEVEEEEEGGEGKGKVGRRSAVKNKLKSVFHKS